MLQMPLAGASAARDHLKPNTTGFQPPISQARKRQKVEAAKASGTASPTRDLSQKLLWHKRRQQRAMADEEDDACDCDGPPQHSAPDGLPAEAPSSSHHACSSADRPERSRSQPEAVGGPHADSCKAHAACKPSEAPDVSLAQPTQQQRAASGCEPQHEGLEARSGMHDHAEQPRAAPPTGHRADPSLHEPAGRSSSDCARVLLQGSGSGTYKDARHEQLGSSGMMPLQQQQQQQQQQADSKRKLEESAVPGYDSDGSCTGSLDERWQRIAAAFSPLEDLFFHPELSAALRYGSFSSLQSLRSEACHCCCHLPMGASCRCISQSQEVRSIWLLQQRTKCNEMLCRPCVWHGYTGVTQRTQISNEHLDSC